MLRLAIIPDMPIVIIPHMHGGTAESSCPVIGKRKHGGTAESGCPVIGKRERRFESQSVMLVPEDYECPVCMEPMIGEIRQCHAGHTLCKRCLDKMMLPRAYLPILLIGHGWNHKLAVARAKVNCDSNGDPCRGN